MSSQVVFIAPIYDFLNPYPIRPPLHPLSGKMIIQNLTNLVLIEP